MQTFREMISLVEDVNTDVSMFGKAMTMAQAIQTKIYRGVQPAFELGLKGHGDFLAFQPEDLGVGSEMPTTLFLLGLKQSGVVGMSAACLVLDGRMHNRYSSIIKVHCLASLDMEDAKKRTSNVEFLDVVSHEIIHLLDANRTNNAMFAKNINATDKASYFNDPAEFNAYFHNVASNLLAFIHDARKEPDTAREMAEIHGISTDFKETLAQTLKARGAARAFLEWLSDGRQKALVKRLYKIHQEVVRLILDDTAPAR